MANEININTLRPQTDGTQFQQPEKLSGDDAKIKEIMGKVSEILAGANVKFTRSDDPSVTGGGEKKTTGSTNVPVLDNPGDVKAMEAALEKLIAYLQLDNQDRQTEMTKERIDLNKSGLDTEHKDRMKQIEETIKKMEKAEKASLISRIFGWIGAILAVVAAAVITVASGGVAAGFAIAGAVLAVSSLILNETGAMDKIVTALAEHLQEKYGMSKNDAMLAASLIVNLSIMVAQLGCAIGSLVAGIAASGKVAADAGKTVTDATTLATKTSSDAGKLSSTTLQFAKQLQNLVSIANAAVGTGSLTIGAVTTYLTFKSESAKADTTELEKFMTMLQQRLEESQEELQELLQQIQSGISKIVELISSATDTSTEISRNIGAMA